MTLDQETYSSIAGISLKDLGTAPWKVEKAKKIM